jgi:DNA-binding NtrC family response regulator
VVQGPEAGKTFAAGTSKVAIGTSPENEVVLSDPSVSRYHLEIEVVDSGIRVCDLGSLNGTYVGNVAIADATVPPFSRIQIGASLLSIEEGEASPEDSGPGQPLEGVIYQSQAMRKVADETRKLGGTELAVLIWGETGVGKEAIARAIHSCSARSSGPLETVDCGSLPAALIASELFGHEKGAFTGADSIHHGAFERANGGTVFLDEIGELPMQVQPILLGVLERRRFRRVGGSREIETDVRVVSATNRDLRREANKGSFRADLFHRLAGARIHIPPLRDRPEDIAPLVAHFADEYSGLPGSNPFGEESLQALQRHRWTGNVRELRNVVEVMLSIGELRLPGSQRDTRSYKEARKEAIESFEHRFLSELIEHCGGNASAAARMAQMDRPYLLTLLRKHGLR